MKASQFRRALEDLELTQKAAAELLRVSLRTVEGYVAGSRRIGRDRDQPAGRRSADEGAGRRGAVTLPRHCPDSVVTASRQSGSPSPAALDDSSRLLRLKRRRSSCRRSKSGRSGSCPPSGFLPAIENLVFFGALTNFAVTGSPLGKPEIFDTPPLPVRRKPGGQRRDLPPR
jgi:hypothetical protein